MTTGDIKWFDRRAGSHVLESKDGDMLLLTSGHYVPESIGFPEELGGGRHKVDDSFVKQCACGRLHESTHFRCGELYVTECSLLNQFLWYKK